MAGKYTFTMIKPDAVSKNNIGGILEMMNAAGFRIVSMKLTQLSAAKAGEFYAVHSERPFYGELVEYMTSGPIIAAILEKDNAVEDFRNSVSVNGTLNKVAADSFEQSDGSSITLGDFQLSINNLFILNLPKALIMSVISPKIFLPIVVVYKLFKSNKKSSVFILEKGFRFILPGQ